MFVKQLSVFMENRPGSLSNITDILSENDIDIRAINIADTAEFGILRLIVDDAIKAENILRLNNMTVNITEVIVVSIDDTIGAFGQAVSILKNDCISIEYIYSFIGEKSSKALLALNTSDNEASYNLLKQGGINTLIAEDINNLKYAE